MSESNEQNDYYIMRDLMRKSYDHTAAVSYVQHSTPGAKQFKKIAQITTTAAGALSLLLLKDESGVLKAGSEIMLVSGACFLSLVEVLKGMNIFHLRRLKQTHPARLTLILDEIRSKVASVSSTVDSVKNEFFPPQ
jgi:hypothetical protein